MKKIIAMSIAGLLAACNSGGQPAEEPAEPARDEVSYLSCNLKQIDAAARILPTFKVDQANETITQWYAREGAWKGWFDEAIYKVDRSLEVQTDFLTFTDKASNDSIIISKLDRYSLEMSVFLTRVGEEKVVEFRGQCQKLDGPPAKREPLV